MHYRAQLTALHQNENAIRNLKAKSDGERCVKIHRSKNSGMAPTAYNLKADASYGKKSKTFIQNIDKQLQNYYTPI